MTKTWAHVYREPSSRDPDRCQVRQSTEGPICGCDRPEAREVLGEAIPPFVSQPGSAARRREVAERPSQTVQMAICGPCGHELVPAVSIRPSDVPVPPT